MTHRYLKYADPLFLFSGGNLSLDRSSLKTSDGYEGEFMCCSSSDSVRDEKLRQDRKLRRANRKKKKSKEKITPAPQDRSSQNHNERVHSDMEAENTAAPTNLCKSGAENNAPTADTRALEKAVSGDECDHSDLSLGQDDMFDQSFSTEGNFSPLRSPHQNIISGTASPDSMSRAAAVAETPSTVVESSGLKIEYFSGITGPFDINEIAPTTESSFPAVEMSRHHSHQISTSTSLLPSSFSLLDNESELRTSGIADIELMKDMEVHQAAHASFKSITNDVHLNSQPLSYTYPRQQGQEQKQKREQLRTIIDDGDKQLRLSLHSEQPTSTEARKTATSEDTQSGDSSIHLSETPVPAYSASTQEPVLSNI